MISNSTVAKSITDIVESMIYLSSSKMLKLKLDSMTTHQTSKDKNSVSFANGVSCNCDVAWYSLQRFAGSDMVFRNYQRGSIELHAPRFTISSPQTAYR